MIDLGSWTLVERIGSGGMGEVWAARASGDRAVRVAVKVLTSERARSDRFRRQFRDEVRSVGALAHPNVIEVLDYGLVPEGDGTLSAGSPFMAMELCPRGSLGAVVGRCDWDASRRILLELLSALAHAHARGVIHLDIKPENVLVGDDGAVRLSDFGIAHALERESDDVQVGGTPRYMAPEQLEGRWREYGPPTDLFALGRVAIRLATAGTRVPGGFASWLGRLLAIRPGDRFACAADAMSALESLSEPLVAFEPSGTRDDGPTSTAAATGATGSVRAAPQEAPPNPPSEVGVRPLPVRWRADMSRRIELRGLGVGVGLFGLRQVGLVGRERERGELWDRLRAVQAEQRPRVVVVHGASGTGKSRLASWLREQAHEAGATSSLKAVYAAASGETDGLAGMIRRHLKCAGLTGAALSEHVEHVARAQGATDPYEWSALATLAFAGAEPQPVRFANQTERFVVIARLAERLAANGRPVMVWLDDVQWGAEALGLAKLLLGIDAAVLVVATVRDEALAERPVERALLEEIAAHPRASRVHLAPLPEAAHRELCHELLGLSEELSARVEQRTAGSPLFAVQLVGDWVARGVLVPGADGFSLHPSAAADLPEDLIEVWARRVDRVIEERPELDARALEIAALLGGDVDAIEWRDACRTAGIAPGQDANVLDALLDARLASEGGDGSWAFVHPMLRECVEHRARGAGRLPELHRACERMLVEKGGRTERRAVHLVAAGDLEEAIEPLLHAAQTRLREGAGAIAAELLDERERALRSLGYPESDVRWAQGFIERGHVARFRLDMDLAVSLNRRAAEASERDPELRLRALFGLSDVHREAGRHAVAAEVLEEARPIALASSPRARGELHRREGHLAKARGELARARELAERAVRESSEAGDDHAAATASLLLATVLWREGRLGEAAASAAAARDTYERLGSQWGIASSENTLGEIARLSGKHEDAIVHYRRALSSSRAIGSKHAILAEVNVGLVLVEQGRLAEARPIFERGLPILASSPHVAAWLHAALLPCVAATREEERWRGHFEAVEKVAVEWVDADLARMVGLGADRAVDVWPERARAAYELALAQWRKMGRSDEVSSVEAKLRHPA